MSFNISSSLKDDIFSEIAKSIRFSLNSSNMNFSSSEKLNFKTLYLFHTLITILLNYDLMSVHNIQALLNMADG